MDYWRGGSFDDYKSYVDSQIRPAVLEALDSRYDREKVVDAIITATAFAQLAPDGGTPSTDAHIHIWGTRHLHERANKIIQAMLGPSHL